MNRSPAKIAARYPGSCLCGAKFQPGALIYWDGSVRRATGCPSCAPRKAIAGRPFTLPGSGLVVRFDRHPDTGAVVLCQVTDPCGAWGAAEVYALVGGTWTFRAVSREPVLNGTPTHGQIEAWRALAEAAETATAA